MVAEEIVVSLSGGAPWGFRLQGGAEQQKPLQVAKVRRRSKACRAGLKEHDELVAIGDQMCTDLSHAQAMGLLDTPSTTLNLTVKRAPCGFHSPSILSRVLSPTSGPLQQDQASIIPTGITSPPDSEAYYGETDSDADIQSLTPRQHRTPPHVRSPARYDNQTEEEMSEMSGYESATDAVVTQRQWDVPCTVGVPRRELIYRPLQPEWTTPTHTPQTLTPHTLSPTPDQSLGEAEGEGDSGFQETGGSGMPVCPPLVSPERAKEALMLGSGKQLVSMVGLQQTPVNDELCTTYREKARQAKLQRGESVVEKQVKEARTKCRSIASLLTDAPNPNSKGVLMFKKRRQRAKKYTLTCFGKAPEDRGTETEGETGGETEEEGGSSIQSGSEVDEEGFSGSFDPTWDTGYLDFLERRSSACPSTTPTTPTTNHSPGFDISAYQTSTFGPVDYQSPKLEVISGLDTLAYQDSNLENSTTQPIHSLPNCAPMSPPAMGLTNGGSVAVSRASVVLTPQSQTPLTGQNAQQDNPNPNVNLISSFSPNLGVLNRSARPFTPGPSAASRPTVTSVMFRPPQPKPVATPPKPVAAVSMVTLSPTRQPDSKRAVSSTSLYIPARNTNGNLSDLSSIHSPPSSLSSATLSQPATNPPTFSPPFSMNAAWPYHPPPPQPLTSPTAPNYPYAAPVPPVSQPYTPKATRVSMPTPAFPPTPSVNPYFTTQAAMSPSNPPSSPHVPANDSLATREQRISVPAARTGILNDARKRSNKKPMFHAIQSKDVSPNPDLLSMVQNMDDRFEKRPAVETSSGLPSGEVGHESGPEEDWLRLGAEACNFMQAQRQPKPPPVAPKPVTPQMPQLAGKGGELFAKRQNRMDRYVVERSPSVAAAPYSPAQTREPSPTPSLPCAWKYSSNIRAPPPINYNPLLSPSCPLIAQKKIETPKTATSKGQKAGPKPVDITNHQPYQLNSSLFNYRGGVPQESSNSQPQRGTPGNVHKTARIYEVKRFSTPPPTTTGLALKVIVPRSATTLGEPLWHSAIASPPPSANTTPYQPPYQPQWNPSPLTPPPAPNAPLPELPNLSSSPGSKPTPNPATANRQFKSVPDLSPVGPAGSSPSNQLFRVPRPRFSTSNLGLQPGVWRPGSTMY